MGYLLGILSSHLIKLHKKVLGHCQEICLQLACEQDLWSRMGKRESRRRERERREREGKGGSPNPNHTSLTHFNLSQFLLRLASHADALRARHAFLPTKECVSPALQARLIYRSFQPSSDPSSQSLFTDYFHNWYLSIFHVLSSSLASLRRNQQKINQKSIVKCQVNKAFFNAILTEIIN